MLKPLLERLDEIAGAQGVQVTDWEKRPIEEVIKEAGIELIPQANGSFYARCPFHSDRRPSFEIQTTNQRCLCKSCWPEGGDVIDFTMKLRGCSFPEALPHCTTPLTGPDALLKRLMRPQDDGITSIQLQRLMTKMLDLRNAHGESAALMLYTEASQCQTKDLLELLLTSPKYNN